MVPVQQNDRVFVGKEYIVEANDSLQSIAHRFGTSEENLVSVFMQASSQDCSIHPFHCFTTRNSPNIFQLRINADLVQNAPLSPGSAICVISSPCAFAN